MTVVQLLTRLLELKTGANVGSLQVFAECPETGCSWSLDSAVLTSNNEVVLTIAACDGPQTPDIPE